jgi:adenylate cyclase
MKHYLNRNDREHHITILVFWDYINNWLKKQTALTKEEAKYLKTASTLLRKISDSIILRLDKKFAEQLIREVTTTQLALISIYDKNTIARSEETTIKLDDLYDLASFSLENCTGCKCKDFSKCEKYKLFMRLALPVAQTETDGCPYEN